MSGNKQKDNRLASLIQANFGEKKPNNSPDALDVPKETFVPPAMAMQIQVPIDKIECYEHNPRVSENEIFQNLKASIKEVGLEQPFKITHRPGTASYIIRGGGNTRLKILKELFAETGDPKFGLISCDYVPFTDDIDLLSKHMMENELRGKMLFIDKAKAILHFKDMLEVQKRVKLSHTDLVEEMYARGWTSHRQHIPWYLYACEIADQLPKAFAAGLGRTYLEKIKALSDKIEQWAKDRNLDVDKVLLIFFAALKQCDAALKNPEHNKNGPLIDLRKVDELTRDRLSKEFGIKNNRLKGELDYISEEGSMYQFDEESNDLEVAFVDMEKPKKKKEAKQIQNQLEINSDITNTSAEQKFQLESNQFVDHNNGFSNSNKLAVKIWECVQNIQAIQGLEQLPFTRVMTQNIYQSDRQLNEVIRDCSNPDDLGMPPDTEAIFFALFYRAEILEYAINHRHSPEHAKKHFATYSNPEYLNDQNLLNAVALINHYITLFNTLPLDLFVDMCGGIKMINLDAIGYLSDMDRLIKQYLDVVQKVG